MPDHFGTLCMKGLNPADTSQIKYIAKTLQKRLNLGLKEFIHWFKMPRFLPGDVFKNCFRRLKPSSRLFLVNEKYHQETIYGISIYVRFKFLFLCYHSITRQTNCITLNKLNTLTHENNSGIMKPGFQ